MDESTRNAFSFFHFHKESLCHYYDVITYKVTFCKKKKSFFIFSFYTFFFYENMFLTFSI